MNSLAIVTLHAEMHDCPNLAYKRPNARHLSTQINLFGVVVKIESYSEMPPVRRRRRKSRAYFLVG